MHLKYYYISLLFFYVTMTGVLSIVNDRVSKINELLQNPQWIKFQNSLKVVENGNEEQVNKINKLLLDENDVIVTEENIDEKIQQLHLLLSCNYAKDIKDINDLLKRYMTQCKQKEIDVKSCEDDLQNILNNVFLTIKQGQNILSFFTDMSTTEFEFTNVVPIAITSLHRLTSYNLQKTDCKTEEELNSLDELLQTFIVQNCSPIINDLRDRNLLQVITKETSKKILFAIKSGIREHLEQFSKFNRNLGFLYNLEDQSVSVKSRM